MSFVVTGLPLEPFRSLFGLSDAALTERGVIRRTVDANPGFPCRVTLEDARPGETVLLLNYEHQSADTPYRARHAIYVSEQARETRRAVDVVPGALRVRKAISLRAFDEAGMMLEAEVAPGDGLEPVIERLLALPGVIYLHAHDAAMGCYAARIDRG
ncbi:DUF1203 domain-containing protein [Phenylobacterium sp.]|uniref:DUF1203 domain-containing protein n=1 Tax=Phenylobacterium sp. TaxID=1871053 RepID=UPI002869F393|nr:DUF1203 domain-containing protein [Phenylobacterium sp.]